MGESIITGPGFYRTRDNVLAFVVGRSLICDTRKPWIGNIDGMGG